MIKKLSSGAALALLAAASFALGLWSLIRVEAPLRPGGDYNVQVDITPLSIGFLLAGIALIFLRSRLRRQAALRVTNQTEPT
jgi:hypothetical protein